MKNVDNVIVAWICLFFVSKRERTFSVYLLVEKARSFYTRSSVNSRKTSGVIILQNNGKAAVEVTTYSVWCLLFYNTCGTQPTEKYLRERKLGIKFDIAVHLNKKAKSWHVRLFCVLQENQRMTGFIFQWKKWNASCCGLTLASN